jgi:hypothetical protein
MSESWNLPIVVEISRISEYRLVSYEERSDDHKIREQIPPPPGIEHRMFLFSAAGIQHFKRKIQPPTRIFQVSVTRFFSVPDRKRMLCIGHIGAVPASSGLVSVARKACA